MKPIKKEEAIDYILSLDEDFSVCDIIDAGFSKTYAHVIKTQLLDAGAIFHVGFRYVKSGECKTYNTTERPLDPIPSGTPKTGRQQIMEYMLWLDKEFTIMDIREALNTSRTIVYHAKKRLMESELLFHVKTITDGNVRMKVFSSKKNKLSIKNVDKVRKYKEPKAKPRKKDQPIFNPVDPLKGFIMPVASI